MEGDDTISANSLIALEPKQDNGKALLAAAMIRAAQFHDHPELIKYAKQHAAASLITLPHNIYAREALWRSALAKADSAEAMKQLYMAHRYLPGNLIINFELAKLIAKSEEPAKAIPILEKVLLWTHDPEMATEVLTILTGVKDHTSR